jgi:hypothetical protein
MLKRALAEVEPLVLTGELELTDEQPKILVKTLEWAQEAHKNRVQQVVLRLNPSLISPDQLRALKKSMIQNRGKCPVRIDFDDKLFKLTLNLPKTVGVAATPQFMEAVTRIFGSNDCVRLQ